MRSESPEQLLARPAVARLAPLAALVLLAGLAVFAYGNATPDAVVFDDQNFFPYEYSYTGADVADFFTKDTWEQVGGRSGVYRPLLMLSIAADQALHPNDPAAFHRTNVALHALATLLVFGLLLSLFAPAKAAALEGSPPAWLPAPVGAALFAVHPIHTEAVSSIFNRSEILGTIGVVAALWLVWTEGRRRPILAWAVAAVVYFAALLCKESAATAPALFAALVLALRTELPWRARIKAAAPALVLLVPLAAYLALRVRALGGVAEVPVIEAETFVPLGWGDRIAITASSVRDSLRMLVWPLPFRATFREYEATQLALAVVVHVGAAAFVAVAVARRRFAGIVAGLAFVYVAILPSTRLFTNSEISMPLAERYVYLPSVGLSIAAAYLVAAARGRRRIAAAAVIALAIVAVCVPVTRSRNAEWHSNVALFEAEVGAAPEDGDAIRLLANAYLDAKRPSAVVELCDRHLAAHRDNAQLLINCGVAFANVRRYRDAEEAYLEAGKSTVRSVPHANLAGLYTMFGHRKRAEEQYLEAEKEEVVPAQKHLRHAQMILALDRDDPARLDEAISELEKAIALKPRMGRAKADLEFAKKHREELRAKGAGQSQTCGTPQPAGCAQPQTQSCNPK